MSVKEQIASGTAEYLQKGIKEALDFFDDKIAKAAAAGDQAAVDAAKKEKAAAQKAYKAQIANASLDDTVRAVESVTPDEVISPSTNLPVTVQDTIKKRKAQGTEASTGPTIYQGPGERLLLEAGESAKPSKGSTLGKKSAIGAGVLGLGGAGYLATRSPEEAKEEFFKQEQDLADYQGRVNRLASTEEAKPKDAAALVSQAAKAYEQVEQDIGKQIKALKAPAEYKSNLKETLDALKAEQDSANAQYKKDKDRLAWAEVAETMGQALAQFGAGLQGLKTGQDLSSGLKFNRANWEAKMDSLLRDVQSVRGDIDKRRSLAADLDKEAARSSEREQQDYRDRLFRLRDQLASAKVGKGKAIDEMKLEEEKRKAALEREKIKVGESAEKAAGKLSKEQEDAKREIDAIIYGLPEDMAMNEAERKKISENLLTLGYNGEQIKELLKDEKKFLMLFGGGGVTPKTYEERRGQTNVAGEKRQDVQAYADQYFGGDYNKAEQFLKGRGDL